MNQRAMFTLDIEALRKDLLEMGHRAPLIMSRALNRAAATGRTAMVKVISADIALQSKYVNRAIVLDKASRIAPRAGLTIEADRIPLIAFSARGPKPSRGKGRGVSYRLPGGRGRIPNAFIATMPNPGPEAKWHEGVFTRWPISKGKSRGAWSKNLPIRQEYGPSVAHVFIKHLDKFRAAAQDSLVKNLMHEISFEKSKNQPADAPASTQGGL